MSRLLLLLILVASCSSDAPTQPPGSSPDAGPLYDWSETGLPPGGPSCGNGVVDPGESCDDANDMPDDGCAACRYTTRCGDGIQTADEACDDGNQTNGDGCRASCEVERCGDGYFDLSDSCADPTCVECGLATCGDGAVQAGEGCDDGGRIGFDGCSAACAPEQVFTATLGFATESALGCDVDGSGVLRNAFGDAIRPLAFALNAYLADQLATAAQRPSIVLSGWSRGEPAPATFRIAFLDSELVDPLLRTVRLSDGFSIHHASLVDGEIVSEPADMRLELSGVLIVDEPVRRMTFRLRPSPDATRPRRLEGTVCGVNVASSLAYARDPLGAGADDGQPLCADIGREASVADTIAGGRTIGIIPTPMDVDLDGDGLERFIVAGENDPACAPVIIGCVEGDGTVIMDPDCVYDVDDGWSVSFSVIADRAAFAPAEEGG